MEEIQVKILRLNTGEDIMGSVLMDDKHRYVSIENPMRVILKRMSDKNQTMLLMAPWLPVELLIDNFATIDYHNIITVVDPKPSFSEYYNNTVGQFNEKLNSQEMEEVDCGAYEYYDDEEDDDNEEVQKAVTESKKAKLH
jgi:hypothetical protein